MAIVDPRMGPLVIETRECAGQLRAGPASKDTKEGGPGRSRERGRLYAQDEKAAANLPKGGEHTHQTCPIGSLF